jgi:lipopolysaccharide/colanic/teichoic acid biosynthesis glycosyltransferase
MTNPIAKRIYDAVFAALGLVLFSPVYLVIALLVKLSDGGPVFYRQQRVGQGGRLFWIWKFRTMVVNADRQGLSLTKDGDARITPLGRWLRKSKLDELPQLWNVLCGEMSFVGPRPEVPQYVALYTEAQREVLRVKPGITDIATLAFRHEEDLLASAPDTEAFYREQCLPRKIELNLQYQVRANLWQDTRIILETLFGRSGRATGRGI